MTDLKIHSGIAYLLQCRSTGIPYSSLMRWRSRIRADRPPALRPGPKPVGPLNLEALHRNIIDLKHGRKRTWGTGALYRCVSDGISRRDFQEIVSEARIDSRRLMRQSQCRITWHAPGMVWAFDDMEYDDPGFKLKHYIHSIRDLASRYIFPPLSGFRQAEGDRIAVHLENLFQEYGPPLFLKRDNGGNLNHHEVNRVLAEWMVIPYNSPPYYPQFNGSIEQTQHELKTELTRMVCGYPQELSRLSQIAADSLNHRPRPCLNGNISCRVFSDGKSRMKPFTRRKRKEIFEQIQHLTTCIAHDEQRKRSFDSAWRFAIQIWLREHGWISMTNHEKCYPVFSTTFTHN